MKMPRLRLSLRWLMAAVALLALCLAYVLPACQKLLWLYQHPKSVKGFGSTVLCRPAPGEPPQKTPAMPTYDVGLPFRMQVSATCWPGSWIPEGLTYRVDVVVSVTDPTTFTKIYSTQRKSRRVRSGPRASGEEPVISIFEISPPGPGAYAVRTEQEVIDFFGRTSRAGLSTTFFNAR
ncbi:hypothetical protein [Singulisphaera sp. PoT]|uniref:hypothetical protein n=1 Tax=Singulisphaera sp. PoT TaxID=3411797 RepID=UPI003BF48C67